MKAFRKLRFRLRALFRGARLDREMDDELRFHIEQQARENIAAGMSPDEAARSARLQFGWPDRIREDTQNARGLRWLNDAMRDSRYALRTLGKSPGFTIVAVLTLALGIGANTAIFSVINALMLRALPVSEPDRLVHLRSTNSDESFSFTTFERFREARSLEGIALAQRGTNQRALIATGFGEGDRDLVRAQAVSGSYFSVLGVSPAIGRALSPDDDRSDQPQALVVLSHAYWQRRFGGSTAIVGQSVLLDNVPFTIAGVMPAGFSGFELGINPDVWFPVQFVPQFELNPNAPDRLKAEGWEWALLIGRLRTDVSREQAQAELHSLFLVQRTDIAARNAKFTEKERREYLARTIELTPGAIGYTSLRQHLARPLSILAVVVGLVLFIACANLAGLLLARGAARHREFTVRAALGAGRGRLVRQLVTESLLLASLGGIAGVQLAQWGTTILGSYLPKAHGALDLSPDARVLVFAIGIAALTGVLFGLAPALRLSSGALTATGRTASNGSRSRLNQSLVVGQIALSVTLLAGAGLFVRSLQKLKSTDLGFQPDNLVGFALDFPRTYDARQRSATHREFLAALTAQPDVRSATLSSAGLLGGDGFGIRVGPEGYTPEADETVRALVVVAGPRFFETLGIPLLAGREFTSADEPAEAPQTPNTPRVVVLGESFARRYFGDVNPLGRTLRWGLNEQLPPLEIVGVVKDIKYRNLREKPEMEIYVPYFGGVMNLPMTVHVATRTDSRALEANLRAIAKHVDAGVAVTGMRTMNELVDSTLMQERLVAQLGAFFSVFALILASLGLYGALSYGVVQRTREIGVRMALGACARDVLTLVIGQGMKLALLGTTLGVAAALATTRFAAKLLFGVTPMDPATFTGVAALLLIVATIAAWLPARRAAKVDPMVALRAE